MILSIAEVALLHAWFEFVYLYKNTQSEKRYRGNAPCIQMCVDEK